MDMISRMAIEEKLRDMLKPMPPAFFRGPARRRGPAPADEPVAIVGMACRLPGDANSPQELWQLVDEGRDAVSELPADRGWVPAAAEGPDADAARAQRGCFVRAAHEFDAAFFGIAAREAAAMEPQQRLLLEAAWEALERAGIRPGTLRGSDTAVYVGATGSEHTRQEAERSTGYRRLVRGVATTGAAPRRVAGVLGLAGPVVSVDTACSSSLVAVHLAGQALRRGDCGLALAAGTAVTATPGLLADFAVLRAAARNGRTEALAGTADGPRWGEGVAVLALERLSDARRTGHRVLALVRGSAVDQGRADGTSQRRVIQRCLADAALDPRDVDAVEGHGAGSAPGDRVEAAAVLAVYGHRRPADRPLWLGSVKPNIGDTRAAAGIAGIIEMVEAMRHQTLPRTLHAHAPAAGLERPAGTVAPPTAPVAWPRGPRPRRAAVSSFGNSGVHAHVIVEEPPMVEPQSDPTASGPAAAGARPDGGAAPAGTPLVFVLSGRTEAALRGQSAQLAEHLTANPDTGLADAAATLVHHRTQFEHRAATVAATRDQLVEQLAGLAVGTEHPDTAVGRAGRGKTAFLFSGQGSQRATAGRELYRSQPVFADALDAVCAHLDPQLGRSLKDLMFADLGTFEAELLNQTLYTQSTIFALETALYRLVEHWGLAPDYLIGHSIGELAAAHAAGVLSLRDAAVLVYHRARLMQDIEAEGAMLSVMADRETVAAELDGRSGVTIAALNTPNSTVISGDTAAVVEIAGVLGARGVKAKRLRVSHAFHSPHLDPILDELIGYASGLDFRPPSIPIISNLTGQVAEPGHITTPRYWADHARQAVRFTDGVVTLRGLGVTRYLECGPTPVLTPLAQNHFAEADGASFATLLRTNRPEDVTARLAVGKLHTTGLSPDWSAFQPWGGQTDLPTYAFQRSSY